VDVDVSMSRWNSPMAPPCMLSYEGSGKRMSRADTIAQARWRVQVLSPEGTITHESSFKVWDPAQDYYNTLHIVGSLKRLQVREEGETRFKPLQAEVM
jgi:hypothetical protein